ncbi:unnamed protein product [Cylicostephanus goldi]|uniref:Uncharacterized protein n=1 Tax=Cylicostephanus goldi TaxID=71465 RepID=A0A3P6TTM9_CYLGO|nr:unnamed protein product [Cylicostephanus goldi]
MFMTPPPFAFPPPFAPPGFAVPPMNAPPPPFPPYNQFQPPPNIPYPVPPRVNATISAPINTSFPPPPHPPAAPSPRVTQSIPPPLIPPLVNVSSIPPSAQVNAHFSPMQYTAPPPATGTFIVKFNRYDYICLLFMTLFNAFTTRPFCKCCYFGSEHISQ